MILKMLITYSQYSSNVFSIGLLDGIVRLKQGAILDYDLGPRSYRITVVVSTENSKPAIELDRNP